MELQGPGRPRPDAGLYARAEKCLPEVARRVVEAHVAEQPLYAMLPREQLDGEITQITVHHLGLFLRVLREARSPTEAELTEVMSSAARRAQERLPLPNLLAALHTGARVGWEALVEFADDQEVPDLLAAVPYLLRYLQTVTAAVSAVWSQEQQAIHGEEREARRALVAALLSGEPTELLADRAGIPVAPAYVVLALHLPLAAGDRALDTGGAVALRRRNRRVQEVLQDFARAPVLTVLEAGGGIALLPATPETLPAVAARLPALLDRMATADVPVVAGVAQATDPAGVPTAAAEAREVADLVSRLGHPPGPWALDDVLLEYQLTRPSPARERLVERLTALRDVPYLLETLETYVRLEHDRRASATALHVHPNTLDYRLRRIAELTGLDPATPSHARLLAASLTALAGETEV